MRILALVNRFSGFLSCFVHNLTTEADNTRDPQILRKKFSGF